MYCDYEKKIIFLCCNNYKNEKRKFGAVRIILKKEREKIVKKRRIEFKITF